MDQEFTKEQPQDGETILHCGHTGLNRKFHFWKCLDDGLKFRRPDGTFGKALWVTCCDRCFVRSMGDPKNVQIRGDGTWKGNEPFIVKPEND